MSEDSMVARAVIAGVEVDRKSRDVWAEGLHLISGALHRFSDEESTASSQTLRELLGDGAALNSALHPRNPQEDASYPLFLEDVRMTGHGLLRHNPDGTRTRVDPARTSLVGDGVTLTRELHLKQAPSTLPETDDHEFSPGGVETVEVEVAELVPPPEHDKTRWHWVQCRDEAPVVWQWLGTEAQRPSRRGWQGLSLYGDSHSWDVGETPLGYRYLGPAEYVARLPELGTFVIPSEILAMMEESPKELTNAQRKAVDFVRSEGLSANKTAIEHLQTMFDIKERYRMERDEALAKLAEQIASSKRGPEVFADFNDSEIRPKGYGAELMRDAHKIFDEAVWQRDEAQKELDSVTAKFNYICDAVSELQADLNVVTAERNALRDALAKFIDPAVKPPEPPINRALRVKIGDPRRMGIGGTG